MLKSRCLVHLVSLLAGFCLYGPATAAEKRIEPAPRIESRSAPSAIQRQPVAPTTAVRRPVTKVAWDFGCAEDQFSSTQRVARQIKLRMPILTNELLGVVPEPAVVHSDLDGSKSGSLTQCGVWAGGHACYNGHEGTDYMLGGAFLQMGMVRAVAAAPGKVIFTREDQFDGCHVTTDIGDLTDGDNHNNIVCADPDHPETTAVNDANKVSVCHADGTVTEYVHLMRDSVPGNVTSGQSVQCGQVVGTVGSSGNSSAPHLHFNVLVPASRAALMGHPNGQSKDIGGRSYVYLDPYHTTTSKRLWTSQDWNYAGNFSNTLPVPALLHPNGHATTLACPHLVPPHNGHPGPKVPCTHPVHANGHTVNVAGFTQTVACTHPKHPNGHSTTVPCAHTPVQEHPNGHAGPAAPCTHGTFNQVSISTLTLPGPQCDGF